MPASDAYVWFLVVLMHVTNCPAKCADVPAVSIIMPSQGVCMQVKQDNSELNNLDCWAKPKAK
jgi:hypothetical protein